MIKTINISDSKVKLCIVNSLAILNGQNIHGNIHIPGSQDVSAIYYAVRVIVPPCHSDLGRVFPIGRTSASGGNISLCFLIPNPKHRNACTVERLRYHVSRLRFLRQRPKQTWSWFEVQRCDGNR